VGERQAGRLPYNLARHLQSYAAGKSVAFTVPLDLSAGTPFQRKVWRALCEIPRGQTRSYAWVARRIGRPRAVRAVGAACGANPISILIPCHRVIASDGSLGGFGGGLALKRRLLALEGADRRQAR
jgi:methylated-DNA-[protein]-cysteine S-methyltransferase